MGEEQRATSPGSGAKSAPLTSLPQTSRSASPMGARRNALVYSRADTVSDGSPDPVPIPPLAHWQTLLKHASFNLSGTSKAMCAACRQEIGGPDDIDASAPSAQLQSQVQPSSSDHPYSQENSQKGFEPTPESLRNEV